MKRSVLAPHQRCSLGIARAARERVGQRVLLRLWKLPEPRVVSTLELLSAAAAEPPQHVKRAAGLGREGERRRLAAEGAGRPDHFGAPHPVRAYGNRARG